MNFWKYFFLHWQLLLLLLKKINSVYGLRIMTHKNFMYKIHKIYIAVKDKFFIFLPEQLE